MDFSYIDIVKVVTDFSYTDAFKTVTDFHANRYIVKVETAFAHSDIVYKVMNFLNINTFHGHGFFFVKNKANRITFSPNIHPIKEIIGKTLQDFQT